MAQALAQARYMRRAPRKVGLILKVIRKKNAAKALTALEFLPKRSSFLVAKTLRSALANLSAKKGARVEPQNTWIESCWVNQGPVLKRIHAGSMGRAFPYKRKTCHLVIKVVDSLDVKGKD